MQEKQSGRVSLVGVPDPELEQTSIIEFLLAPVEDEPEHSVLENEFGRIRRHFEETFPPEALTILQLRFYENKTFREIGKALNIKTGTAKLKCHRAMEKFRAWLKKHHPDTYFLLRGGGGGGGNSWMKVISFFPFHIILDFFVIFDRIVVVMAVSDIFLEVCRGW